MTFHRIASACRPAKLGALPKLLAKLVVARCGARSTYFNTPYFGSSRAPSALSICDKKSAGFTLVELLVIGPIVMVTLFGAITFLFNQYGRLVQQNAQLNLQLEAQNILFGLQDDLWYANLFTSTINDNLADQYQPSGGWTYNSTPPTLIISTPALTTNRRSANRTPVYIKGSTCTPPDGNGDNSVLYNNVIYFVHNSNLQKRILTAPANMQTCGTSYTKQNCPAANASASCPADVLLSDHLNTFSITYYDTSNIVTTTPENAESVKVDIGLKDKAYAEDIYATSSIRLRKLNQ
jgi:hypothetical protein